jgi:hypothetical protein
LAEDIDTKIEVLVNALPFPDFVWFKNGQKINIDFLSRKYKIELDGIISFRICTIDSFFRKN